jgi:hypothetical protein
LDLEPKIININATLMERRFDWKSPSKRRRCKRSWQDCESRE